SRLESLWRFSLHRHLERDYHGECLELHWGRAIGLSRQLAHGVCLCASAGEFDHHGRRHDFRGAARAVKKSTLKRLVALGFGITLAVASLSAASSIFGNGGGVPTPGAD